MSHKKRLGIYGGTFSPPHLGHVRAAEVFIEAAELDELVIMPTFLPPHKQIDGEATPDERLSMCQMAFKDLKNTRVSDYEINKGGTSYTHATLTEWAGDDRELYFLVGTDMFLTLDLWRLPEVIFKNAVIAIVKRDGTSSNEILRKKQEFEQMYLARILLIESDVIDISSSEIRNMIKNGEDTSSVLPLSVREFLEENAIYSPIFSAEALSRLEELVAGRMSEKRFRHTLGVRDAAIKIADAVLPKAKSELAAAALLHDIAKEYPRDEQLRMLSLTQGLTEEDLLSESLYHAFAAPYLIRRDFSEFATPSILSSAFYHSTGRAGMTLFEEIIFVADYIEQTRIHPDCKSAKEELFSAFLKNGNDREKNIKALHLCALKEIFGTKCHLSEKGLYQNSRMNKTEEYLKALL